jgi:hypothetical protein
MISKLIYGRRINVTANRDFVVRLLITPPRCGSRRACPNVAYRGWIPFFSVAFSRGQRLWASPRKSDVSLILTLGLFILVINGLMLWLTGTVSGALGLGFRVEGFWPGFWGALVVSVVSTALSLMVRPPRVEVYRER